MSADVNFSEPPALTTIFPRTGFVAGRLGFGGAAIGLTNYLGVYDAAAAKTRYVATAALRDALAGGVNYFDTAPGYGSGLSEEIMGEALADASDAFIATKVQAAAPGKTRASLEASLKRLRRDRIDLLQFHGTSIDRELTSAILRRGGMAEEMARLRDEGLVRAIGFTTEDNNAGVYELIDSGLFDSMQIAYNLLLQHPCEPTRPFGSLFEAKKRGMFTITMRTLTSGIFQKWIRLANPDDRFDYNAALLQFVLSNPLIDVALVGMRTPADVAASLRVWRDESSRIDVAGLWGRYVGGEKR